MQKLFISANNNSVDKKTVDKKLRMIKCKMFYTVSTTDELQTNASLTGWWEYANKMTNDKSTDKKKANDERNFVYQRAEIAHQHSGATTS